MRPQAHAPVTALLLAAALASGRPAAGQDPGKVLGHAKISATQGNFSGPLDDYDLFGIGTANIGDLDDDGVIDLAVGAYFDDDGATEAGAVWILFLQPDGSVKAHQKISETQGGFTGDLDESDLFGWSVGALGDLDGDGVEDLAVGGWLDDDGGEGSDHGAVWILFLNADGTVKSHQKISATEGGFTATLDLGDRFGTSLSALGDLDGDGVIELAAGAIYDDDGGFNRGAIYVLFLNADGTVKSHQKISSLEGGFSGPLDDNDRFSYSSASLRDFDGDGVTDLAAGAILDGDGGPEHGALWLLMLAPDGTVKAQQKISSLQGGFTGDLDSNDVFGRSVATLGDLDGDGVTDLAVGAGGDDDGGVESLGAIWILFMNPDATVKAHQKISATEGSFTGALQDEDVFGQSAAALGDLDGDGVTELGVGALLDDDGGPDRGAVWVLFLSDGTWNNQGHALSGTFGAPTLAGTGTLEPGTQVNLSLAGALPSAPAFLVVGFAEGSAPFKGGVMVPSLLAPGFALPVLTSATGDLLIGALWPAGVPSGFTTWLQVWLADPAGPVGAAASNALSASAP